jgi:hypothetical protein
MISHYFATRALEQFGVFQASAPALSEVRISPHDELAFIEPAIGAPIIYSSHR